jgi:hypothetical protein
MAQFGHRLELDLPDPLAGHSVDLTDLAQRAWLAIDEPLSPTTADLYRVAVASGCCASRCDVALPGLGALSALIARGHRRRTHHSDACQAARNTRACSQVRVRRSPAGTCSKASMSAWRTVAAVWSAGRCSIM